MERLDKNHPKKINKCFEAEETDSIKNWKLFFQIIKFYDYLHTYIKGKFEHYNFSFNFSP